MNHEPLTERAMAKFFNTAIDLANALRDNIQHGREISDETILKLNEFRIAANAIEDLTDEFNKRTNKYNN